tara:strand:+ start:30509 stop:31939 length:1431 start_codon:yes stop_codon:yes gene_type:complete
MLNYIWFALIVIGVFVAGLLGNIQGDEGIAEGAWASAKVAINLAIGLIGLMMLWLGMLRLAERAGLIRVLARGIRPVMTRLFPDVPAEHPAMGAMIMNMAANMLGLGNAATPLGLKAMNELNRLNPNPGTATNAMCTFLAINTSSVTLIPATAIGLVAAAGIANPYAIVAPAIGATFCSTVVAIIAVKFFQRLPFFQVKEDALESSQMEKEAQSVEKALDEPEGDEVEISHQPISGKMRVLIGVVAVMMVTVAVFEFAPQVRQTFLDSTGLQEIIDQNAAMAEAGKEVRDRRGVVEFSGWKGILNSTSALLIPLIFVLFTLAALARGVRVYEDFVEGAKEGWDVALRIMPFLVGMLVALGIFRGSGALMLLQWGLKPILDVVHFPVDVLPMALMRPLSGSGSMSIMSEILATPDIALWIKYTAATMFGSTETTFYVLAVYFGSVAVRRTRHALAAGLCADAAGVIAAVAICSLMFG